MATLSNAEKRFLEQLIASVKRPLNLAWTLTVISALLFVWQAWLLASLFSAWLSNYFNELPLATGVASSWFIGLVVCFLLRPLLNSGRELISQRASLQVRSELRESLLTTMATLGPNLRYFGSDGSLSSQIIDQTDALDGYISSFSVQQKVAASTPIILLIAVAWQSWVAAALLLLTAPLVPIFMILIGHLTARKSAEQFSALAQLSGRFLDWVRGMPTLKRLQATDMAARDLAISSEDYRRRTMDVLKIAFLNGAVLELLAALSIALVAVYLGFGLMGILPWAKGEVPVAYFGALFILLLAPEFYVPLRQLGADYHAKAEAEGAVQSLLPIINAADDIADNATEHLEDTVSDSHIDTDLTHIPAAKANTEQVDVSQAFGLQLSNLSIRSPIATSTALATQQPTNALSTNSVTTAEQPIYRTRLASVSFEVPAGARIALIGDSGSGKSSLLQALMGFVSYEGSIKLVSKNAQQQVELTDANLENLRQNIGYLAQQVALMPLTIAQNLRLANPKASEKELIEVLEVVALWDLINRLPDGLHTQLGDRGQGLSGGQQQRLGIAQLLLRDDSLWLLDEPTEHLDPDTAQRIHELLEQVSRHKTVIWITHAHEQLEWLDGVIRLSLPPTTHKTSAINNQSINQPDNQSVNQSIDSDINNRKIEPLGGIK
ncbi:thiol reductant ABC exporter subunit CydD [Psychrobacter jeotgali]|uniref:thiol reductant ABC exporter subunit CydD n=1 Tax=Psychrobacter jeotgali TaxID=179010 RepID=UPI0019198A89|nr:thiol reductant ABC exporter subunit CydD [Psychrobacter jeotgali]